MMASPQDRRGSPLLKRKSSPRSDGRAFALLAAELGTKRQSEAVAAAAQWLRMRGQVPAGPVSDDGLERIAAAQRIVHIKSLRGGVPTGFAHVRATRDGLVATIRDDVHPVERRFSLAHEIAHTMFFDLALTPPERRVSWTSEEERLADG